MSEVQQTAFGRIRNGTLFYNGNTLWRKQARQGTFGENAISVDNPSWTEFFNDDEMIEISQEQDNERDTGPEQQPNLQ